MWNKIYPWHWYTLKKVLNISQLHASWAFLVRRAASRSANTSQQKSIRLYSIFFLHTMYILERVMGNLLHKAVGLVMMVGSWNWGSIWNEELSSIFWLWVVYNHFIFSLFCWIDSNLQRLPGHPSTIRWHRRFFHPTQAMQMKWRKRFADLGDAKHRGGKSHDGCPPWSQRRCPHLTLGSQWRWLGRS